MSWGSFALGFISFPLLCILVLAIIVILMPVDETDIHS